MVAGWLRCAQKRYFTVIAAFEDFLACFEMRHFASRKISPWPTRRDAAPQTPPLKRCHAMRGLKKDAAQATAMPLTQHLFGLLALLATGAEIF